MSTPLSVMDILYPSSAEAFQWRKHIADEIAEKVRHETILEFEDAQWMLDGCHCPAIWRADKRIHELEVELEKAQDQREFVERRAESVRVALETRLTEALAEVERLRSGGPVVEACSGVAAGHAASYVLPVAAGGAAVAADVSDELVGVLAEHGVPVEVADRTTGPSTTLYSVRPAAGVKVNAVTGRADELALALGEVRVVGAMPGTGCVGVEVPNVERRTVQLGEVAELADGVNVGLGVSATNEPVNLDIASLPHVLVAGTTGSGKSNALNGILAQLLYRSPEDVLLALVDPKRVELAAFGSAPHMWCEPATAAAAGADLLEALVAEMEDRYARMAEAGARTFEQLRAADGSARIVCVVDELAELMCSEFRARVETAIQRVAQLGRAAGIHLVLATQRPSVDVLTGVIKANIPARIAFTVASATDSRVILDQGGAEHLTGKGDGLLSLPGERLVRFQGAFVPDEVVAGIVGSCR